MIKIFTLPGLPGFRSMLFLFLSGVLLASLSSCGKEDAPTSKPEEPNTEKANAEISLKVELGGIEEDEDLRSMTLYAGTNVGRKRPHLVVAKGEKIKAHLIFAYADKNTNGTPVGTPIVLSEKPVEVTLTAASEKKAADQKWSGLEGLALPIPLSEIDLNPNKAWYVMGVIGGRFDTATKKFAFDPNPDMLGADKDFVPEGQTRRVSIPYTFPWTSITFMPTTKVINGVSRTVYTSEVTGVRFRPRGLFLRLNVQNLTEMGAYVLKDLRFPADQGFAPTASFEFPTSLDDLKASKDLRLVNNAPGVSTVVSFPYVKKTVTVVYKKHGDIGVVKETLDISDYKYYLSTKPISNPYIIDSPPRQTDYFWIWLADVTPDASTFRLELAGESLGRLKNVQIANLKRLGIPENKVGLTAARTINIVKGRPFLPLEFVARGNLVRSGYGHYEDGTPDDVQEVGPQYGYPGASAKGLWIAGGTFNSWEVFNWNTITKTMSEKDGFGLDNRFIPTVDDWRTIIPLFRFPGGQNVDHHKEKEVSTGQYWEKNKGDILHYDSNRVIFGTSGVSANIDGYRRESVRIRDWNDDGIGSDYEDIRMGANYHRVSANTIVGTRYLNENAMDFATRRKYFSAYRIEFTPYTGRGASTGGLKVQTVYIGEERLDTTASSEVDEGMWLEKTKSDAWWKEKEEQGEVIERIFPMAGFRNPNLDREGMYARYIVRNVWANNRNAWLALHIRKDGRTVMIGDPDVNHDMAAEPSLSSNDEMLRLFVLEPQKAFEKWGSRN